jgi:uncharacterized membrane protein YjjP (DUF1212 family)
VRTSSTPDRRAPRRSVLQTWLTTPAALEAPLAPPPADPEMRCILLLGAALLGYGLPAHRIEESVLRLARAFGRQVSVFGLPTAVMITRHDSGYAGTYTARAEPGAIDLSRLDALHSLVARVERRELDASAAELSAEAILNGPRRYPAWLDPPAIALVAFGGALMLGAQVRDALWSALIGVGVGCLLQASTRRLALARIVPVLGSMLAVLASCALAHAGHVKQPLVAAFAALFVLLPGLTLTLAMTELATGHLVSGAARGTGAAVVFLQLAFGVLLGLRLGRLDQTALTPVAPAPLSMASLGALLLAIGFSVLLVIRMRDAALTLAISALAFFACRGVGAWLGVEIGVLIAATSVGLCSHAFARHRDRPSSTLTLPGVVMLVPGSLGLVAVSAAALHDPTRAFDLGFQMLMVVIALSTGILISGAALPPRSAM